jgi:hypothetical protein
MDSNIRTAKEFKMAFSCHKMSYLPEFYFTEVAVPRS